MKKPIIYIVLSLLIFLVSCDVGENKVLDESKNKEADQVALEFTEAFLDDDLKTMQKLMNDDSELEGYVEFQRQDLRRSSLLKESQQWSTEELLDFLLEQNIVGNSFEEDELEIISNYSEDKASYVVFHEMIPSNEHYYYQIEDKNILNETYNTMADVYESDEFIVFTFEVNDQNKIINLNKNYEDFIGRILNKENAFILKGDQQMLKEE